MAIDWGIVANALGRGLEGGLQGYQFGKQLERQKSQDEQDREWRQFQQREVTMGRLDRASDRAQDNIQRQAAGETAAREREAARRTALSILRGTPGGEQYADQLPSDFDPSQLAPIVQRLTAPKPDPYGGRTREQYMADRRDEAGITHSFDRPAPPRAWAPTSMQEAVQYEQAKQGARGAGTPKTTEGERRASALLGLVKQADVEIGRMGVPSSAGNIGARVPLVRGLPAFDATRQRTQASDQFVTNLLYLLSGATASPAEIEANKRIYIPAPGDDEATLARKAQARQQAIQSAGRMAGAAGPQPGAGSDVAPWANIPGFEPPPGGR